MSTPSDGESREPARGVSHAFADLLSQEFSPSTGHLATVVSGCLFAPSLFVFWFVNGVVDFSTALAVGAVASPAGLQVRLAAYVLLVPTFLVARVAVHLVRPADRRAVLSGSCPQTTYLSLDWVSVGILATGLPFALRDVGPWLGANLVVLVGVFFLPHALPPRRRAGVRAAALAAGPAVFLYAKYGALLAAGPDPAAVLGPVATLELAPATVDALATAVNSLAVGPAAVAAFAVVSNHVLTRPELRSVPLARHALPDRDPDRVVVASAAFGTVFYLSVVAVATGRITVVPW
ncbi:hypothetical protein [Halobaculum sp. EA56]|uniref:hypothetical protein n=1 Tax=Halobaculum sp. EA56 TaxID=3421648 RepID=UPI003EB947C1